MRPLAVAYFALALLASASARAQGPAGPAGPAGPQGDHLVPKGSCVTPADWVPKLISPATDANANYVEDEIEQLPPSQTITVVLGLNDCPTAPDVARFLEGGGQLDWLSPYLSVVGLRKVPVSSAIALGQDPRVAMVFYNRPMTLALDTSVAAIKVAQSTEYAGESVEDVFPNLDGTGVRVAVVDSGIDFGHESLPLSAYVAGLDFTYGRRAYRRNPNDFAGHGTFLAGIVAGRGGPNGPRGVAPGAGLIDVKVTRGSGSTTNSYTVARALSYLIGYRRYWGVDVILCGVALDAGSSSGNDYVSRMAQRAVNYGIAVVAPMGNDGLARVPAPAAADGVIAVGALDDQGTVDRGDETVYAGSNLGPRPSDGDGDTEDERKPVCSAPGVSVLSAAHNSTTGYVQGTGTSAAAAHVAGMIALLLQHNPDMRPEDVRERIVASSERLTGNDWEPDSGYGEIDVHSALYPIVRNLGLAGGGAWASGDLVALEVDEDDQAGTDLNGDGDTGDRVLHVHDAASGITTNLAVAGSLQGIQTVVSERLAVFLVEEPRQGNTDLNGDGDAVDLYVAHVYDRETDTLTNTALNGFAKVSGELAFVSAYETSNGLIDYNGDGDTSDSVVHLFDAGTGVTSNLGVAAEVFPDEEIAVFYVRESTQGNTDLNGDGDTLDDVVHVYDLRYGTLRNARVANLYYDFRFFGRFVGTLVTESEQGGQDLNGDGDALDHVVGVVYPGGYVRNSGLACDQHSSFDVDARYVGIQVPEDGQGLADRNGDGDTNDWVAAVYDRPRSTVTNLELASLGYLGTPHVEGYDVAVVVSESAQASTDLNGDGDAGDGVLHIHSMRHGTTTNLGLAVWAEDIFFEDGRLFFRVEEGQQGGTDLNGDGDASDRVLHTLDLASGVVTNSGIAPTHTASDFFLVHEAEQGNADLNGDGDSTDRVLFAFYANSNSAVNLGLAVASGIGSVHSGRSLAVRIGEAENGDTDLNGDGDAADDVIFVFQKH